MKRIIFATVAAMALGQSAHAQSLVTMQATQGLGSLIAAEEPCQLAFDRSAIKAFIQRTIPADYMQFADQLSADVYSYADDLTKMSDTQKFAACTQMRRVAIAYKLLQIGK